MAAHYKKQRIEYLRTVSIVLSNINPEKSIEALESYEDAMFPWSSKSRERVNRLKKKIRDVESEKRYTFVPHFTDNQINAMKEENYLKTTGFSK